MALQSKQTKVTGGSAGTAPSGPKKDGYASGNVPMQMRMAKQGKTNKVQYSGPNVAMPDNNY